jgi:hypothetical protein
MAGSKKVQSFGLNPSVMCALTPGTLGINDAASPDTPSWFRGDTPGSLGCNDHAAPDFTKRVYLLKAHLRRGPQIAPVPNLSNVPHSMLTEYVSQLGPKLLANITWAAAKVELNPGLLASVLLSEKDKPRYYTCPEGTILNDEDCVASCSKNAPGVCSFTIGTDTYRQEKGRIEKVVPAALDVKFAAVPVAEIANEKHHIVKNIHFASGRDAVLGVAVYLKYGEHLVREHLPIFDAEPIPVQWGLVRLAMNPGIGATLSRIGKVRRGEDMFVHGHIARSGHKADSGMTRVVAIALYLSEHVFGVTPF